MESKNSFFFRFSQKTNNKKSAGNWLFLGRFHFQHGKQIAFLRVYLFSMYPHRFYCVTRNSFSSLIHTQIMHKIPRQVTFCTFISSFRSCHKHLINLLFFTTSLLSRLVCVKKCALFCERLYWLDFGGLFCAFPTLLKWRFWTEYCKLFEKKKIVA